MSTKAFKTHSMPITVFAIKNCGNEGDIPVCVQCRMIICNALCSSKHLVLLSWDWNGGARDQLCLVINHKHNPCS
uniref:Uncharacterized protein n=1 Tax=Anguilla anguilla TaxID=7936 RepID=A0A0E9R4A6_ANGAN